MKDTLRLVVGVLGNGASVLLYVAPMLTFWRLIKKRSPEGFSFVPYIVALLDCIIYAWYSTPVVSQGWKNFTVLTISCLGILLQFSFVLIYFWLASSRGKIKVAVSMIAVIIVSCVTAIISVYAFHEHHRRKEFVGSVAVVASAAMYASPLVVVRQVISTKSVEFMPFYFTLFLFISSLLWLAYGLLSHDIFVAAPNLVGIFFSTLQLVIYFKYRKGTTIEDQNKGDLEKDDEKSKQLQQLTVNDSINGKVETNN